MRAIVLIGSNFAKMQFQATSFMLDLMIVSRRTPLAKMIAAILGKSRSSFRGIRLIQPLLVVVRNRSIEPVCPVTKDCWHVCKRRTYG